MCGSCVALAEINSSLPCHAAATKMCFFWIQIQTPPQMLQRHSFVQDFVPKKGHKEQVCQTRTASETSGNRKTVSQRKKKKKGVQPDLRRVSKYPAAIAGFVPDNLPCLPEMCPSETTEGLWRSPSDTLPCDFVVSPSFSRLFPLTDTLPGKSSQLVS